MVTLNLPAAINGDRLAAELAAAGLPNLRPCVTDGKLVITGPTADASHQAAIQAVVSAHTGAVSLTAQNANSLRQRADAALAANSTFLALASPTQAQTLAQVQRLTKESNAVIRLALGKFDTITDTA